MGLSTSLKEQYDGVFVDGIREQNLEDTQGPTDPTQYPSLGVQWDDLKPNLPRPCEAPPQQGCSQVEVSGIVT